MDQPQPSAPERFAANIKGKLGDAAAEAARTAIESNVDEAAAAIEDRYGAVLDPATEATDRVVKFVQARPLTAVGIACVAGFLVGRS